ncbi:surfeit locus protein 6 homolog isoform 1-T2 [Anomaloglossus baeobatrachus]|uniref:surfeit locus protein 6 n=1 Tax=Anomaloglossus baeobatrachus TaxID=238106 RepID=UPI003F4F7AE7
MASLARMDSYLQSLGRKVCAQPSKDRRQKADFRDPQSSDPKKKRKKQTRKLHTEWGVPGKDPKAMVTLPTAQRTDPVLSSFSTVDLLRKRLHDKIEESRCQISNKTLSAEEIEKRRQKRKQERERKKRKRKELKVKATEEATEETPEQEATSEETSGHVTEGKLQPPLVFNKVVAHDEPLNKVMRKKEKKQSVKGNITPMTGKNYKQLLSRLEARKSKLEELRVKDQDKAKDFENKIKWTNVLYKAEGLKIRDDEGLLKTALKRKEKRREQRKKRWDKRVQNTADKMQQRQDKRNRNIKKKKTAKLEKKKNRARKRGRIMPEDLAKASVK